MIYTGFIYKVLFKKWYLTILFFILFISCNDTQLVADISCDECYSDEPDSIDLVVDVSPEYAGQGFVQIIVYNGKYEDNNVYLIDSTNITPYYIYVPVNKLFTVSAIYSETDNGTYIVVDGKKTKPKKVSDVCDEICWYVKHTSIDLRVKFTGEFK